MPQSVNLETRLQIYRKVLVEEFLREFKFLIDVIAGRAPYRGDFTDKIVDVMKQGSGILIGLVPEVLPGMGIAKSVATTLANLGFDALNDERRNQNKFGAVKDLQYEVNFEALRLVLEIVALHASRRYEFVIATKLSDIPAEAVIPFAKAGVERMLEYIARNHLTLEPQHLLMGLMYGRSGAYVSGFFNTRLTGKDKRMVYTAEGIYSRSAFVTAEGKYFIARKASSINLSPLLQDFKDLVPDKVKGFVAKKAAAKTTTKTLTVKFDKANRTDPKYGYALVTIQGVDTYFGLTKEEQSLTKVSASLQQSIRSHHPRYQIFTRADLEGYLKSNKKATFIAYLRSKYPDINYAIYEPALEDDLDLTTLNCSGANFNDCVLNGVKLGGDLSDCQFQNTSLFGADLSKVTAAKNASFAGAHCEFLKATGANLAYANLTGAQCQFSDFTGADLSHIKMVGTEWVGAKLVNLKTEDIQAQTTLKQTQKKQDDALKQQQKKLQALEQQLQQNRDDVIELQSLAKRLEKQLENATADNDKDKEVQAKSLQKLIADLTQERQTRETFSRYCQGKLKKLQAKTEDHENKLNLHDEQIKQLQRQMSHSEAPMRPLMAELSTAMDRLESIEAKQLKTDNLLNQLEGKVNDYVASQQKAIENVFEGLTNMQQEVAKFKKEVRGDMDKMDDRIAKLEARLNERIPAIPAYEKQTIFAQQFLSLMGQLNGLQVPQTITKPLINPQHTIASSQLIFDRKLAEGTFGKIYLGRHCEQSVAIKMLEGRLSADQEKEFVREVKIMSRLHNANIVQFIGACLESQRACLVMEYMSQGSLAHVLANKVLTGEQQRNIAIDIIKGLIFLHSQGVLHKDIKSCNVLLDANGRAKISDFGLSKTNYASVQAMTKRTEAIEWQAPEVLRGESYTDKSDIYSLGMVLWELFTRRKPFAENKLTGLVLAQAIIDGMREDIPQDIPPIFATLIKECWLSDPNQRPGLRHLLRELESYQPRSPSPSSEDYYQKGIEAEKEKNYALAKECYDKAAIRNYPSSKSRLARFALEGLGGSPIDKNKAFRYFKEAAEEGHVKSMYNMARMLEKGDGIKQDLALALHWYQEAAKKGDKDAEQKVALLQNKPAQKQMMKF